MGPRLVFLGTLISGLFLFLFLREVSNNLVFPENGKFSGSGASSCPLAESYPDRVRKWCGLITNSAQQSNIQADVIAAIIWVESGGDPDAYSADGAVGLMQVMPRDGLAADFVCKNGPCFSSRPTIAQLKDAEFNITYGTNIVAQLIEQTGNLREALKAYGPVGLGYGYADRVLEIYNSINY